MAQLFNICLSTCCPPDRGTMAASAWLSVMVKRGVACLKPRTIVCCEWTDSFSAVLDKLESYSEETVDKVIISTNEKFVDPCHVVPLTAPVSVCDQFRCNFVCFYLKDSEGIQAQQQPDAFTILMRSQRDRVLPPKSKAFFLKINFISDI